MSKGHIVSGFTEKCLPRLSERSVDPAIGALWNVYPARPVAHVDGTGVKFLPR